MRYSVCLDTLYPGVSVTEALTRLRNDGFSHYECWGWWDRDTDEMLAAQQATDVTPVGMCTREFTLNDPAKRIDYVAALRETAEVCRKLGCPNIITQVGGDRQGVPYAEQLQSIVDGFIACIPVLEEYGLTLLFEPLNLTNHPGYFLVHAEEAFFIAEAVNDPHVKVLYDIYHQQMTGDFRMEDVAGSIGLIGHFHVAGAPGRNEPLACGMGYPHIMAAVRAAGYEGTVGLEYMPLDDADDGLRRWLEACS